MANTATKPKRDGVTALVPVKNMGISVLPPEKANSPTTASLEWATLTGNNGRLEISVPNFAAMNAKQFVDTMSEAADDMKRTIASMGMNLAVVIVPGVEEAKHRLRRGETLELRVGTDKHTFKGENQIGDFVRALGLNPATVRQWKHRLAEKALVKTLTGMGVDAPEKGGKNNAGRDSVTQQLKSLLDTIEHAMPEKGTWGDRLEAFHAAVMEAAGEIRHLPLKKSASKKKKKSTPSVTHFRISARMSLCESYYVNRPKLKGKVFVGKGEEATCPDCVRFADEREAKRRKYEAERLARFRAETPTPKNEPISGERGTKLHGQVCEAIWDKKVRKSRYRELLDGLEKCVEQLRKLSPKPPERPENATVVCEGDDEPHRGKGQIISKSPEYEAWEAEHIAFCNSPEYVAAQNRMSIVGNLCGKLIDKYEPLREGDLDGDEDGLEDEGL
jgi:hypothetical protein